MQETIQSVTTIDALSGAMLRNQREKLSLDQSEAAKRLGILQTNLSRLELGTTSLTVTQLTEFAENLGFSATEFVKNLSELKDDVKRRGVDVMPVRRSALDDPFICLLAGAALATLVASMLKAR
jgi:transcriptional regulator with XRE-family HTH domain